ncbi:MAG: hypothetical protein IT300_02450 [Dehalococcoidia bacterium]|nr:hypothetical protein [Dehalococcoidia bacterium]
MAKKAPQTITLYHFTGAVHIGNILSDSHLRPSNSNLSRQPHAGPDVVWLTSSGDYNEQGGLRGGRRIAGLPTADKREFRFTVEPPRSEVHHWIGWAKKRRIDPKWLTTLLETAGSKPHDFWVIERPVYGDEWRAVERWDGEAWTPAARPIEADP